jgi:hypothetical protein
MTDQENALLAARVAADRQMAHVDATINAHLLPDAERLLQEHNGSTTDAWALLAMKLANELGDYQGGPQFLCEMLARLAIVTVQPTDQIEF